MGKSSIKRGGGGNKIHRVMNEYKHGHLYSGSGHLVTSRNQAIAIALNENRRRHVNQMKMARRR